MKRQIRRLGAVMIALYAALFVQLNVVQVVRADDYNDNPGNRRGVERDYGRPRGRIISADDVILARSEPDLTMFGRHRTYPEGDLFGPITGYFSFVNGNDGVEKTYNAELVGRSDDVKLDNLVDALLEQEHTNDVVLTLDSRVQRAARDALGNRRGSIVALDPRDGSILALWAFPSYDPNPIAQPDTKAAEAAFQPLLTRGSPLRSATFRETFFPGSTFKVLTAAAGLASGKVTPDQPVYPTETEFVPPHTNRPIHNFGGSRCGGRLLDILRVSCNTAFARMGVDLGADDLVGMAEAFGFGDEPPIDLPSAEASPIESPGFFERNIPLLAQTAIGQNTVRATPLQMALVAAGIANQGRVMAPHVLKEVRDDESRVVRRFRPSVWKTPVDESVAAIVRDAMVAVVESGTARALKPGVVPTAGKTGTAQIGNGMSHAWVIGFAPADAPRVAVAVIVESQSGTTEATGGRVAAPIGRVVLEAALNAQSTSP